MRWDKKYKLQCRRGNSDGHTRMKMCAYIYSYKAKRNGAKIKSRFTCKIMRQIAILFLLSLLSFIFQPGASRLIFSAGIRKPSACTDGHLEFHQPPEGSAPGQFSVRVYCSACLSITPLGWNYPVHFLFPCCVSFLFSPFFFPTSSSLTLSKPFFPARVSRWFRPAQPSLSEHNAVGNYVKSRKNCNQLLARLEEFYAPGLITQVTSWRK